MLNSRRPSGRLFSSMQVLFRARLVLLLLGLGACRTSAPPPVQPPLTVLDSAGYRASIRSDPGVALVDLRKRLTEARFDIRYATPENFMHRTLYPKAEAWLRLPAALALAGAGEELRGRGLGLIVFDAYRPYRVTKEMWDAIHDERFVADPAKGSRHNRGCAVDVSLYELSTGRELEMPTPYDDFTPRAAQSSSDVPLEAARNRETLREVMERHGFQPLPSEWWHYDFGGWRSYQLLDVSFDVLEESQAVGAEK